MPDFHRSVSVAVAIAVAVSVKPCPYRSFMPLLLGRVRGITRQAQEAGRRVSRAKEWAKLQVRRNGRYGKIELDPI